MELKVQFCPNTAIPAESQIANQPFAEHFVRDQRHLHSTHSTVSLVVRVKQKRTAFVLFMRMELLLGRKLSSHNISGKEVITQIKMDRLNWLTFRH